MKTCDLFVSASIVSALFALCGCASAPPQEPLADIRIYRPAELPVTAHEPVAHIWVDSWRTAFYPPTYPSEEEAVRALRAEAARLGANGIVNVVCLDQNVPKKSASAEPPAILCYAYAIRVRPASG